MKDLRAELFGVDIHAFLRLERMTVCVVVEFHVLYETLNGDREKLVETEPNTKFGVGQGAISD